MTDPIRRVFCWFSLSLLVTAGLAFAQELDSRDVRAGLPIPDEGYCDQPRIVTLSDGSWVAVLTTGPGHEGSKGQHVVSTRSEDRGRTWSELVDVEPSDPERPASYAVSYVTPYDRVYAFYTYNGDAVWARPGPDGKPRDERIRADTQGWWCYRYSDDAGATWSERHRIPMRVTASDRGNDWGGEVQMFWAIGDPVTTTDGAVVFAFTKLARYFLVDGEGWFWRSDNLATERDPAKLRFELLPDGDHGLRHPDFGSVQEEFNVVPLAKGRLACVYRTTLGFPAIAYSDDGGHSWSTPERMRYRRFVDLGIAGPHLRNPRACPKIWHVGGDRYLFWFHHHGGTDFKDRNPAWITAGVERDGELIWSWPEIALFGPDRSYETGRFSYPDLILGDDEWFVAETQKTVARVHRLDRALLEGMWRQLDRGEVPASNVPPLFDSEGDAGELPALPDLRGLGGYTVELRCDLSRSSRDVPLARFGEDLVVTAVLGGTKSLGHPWRVECKLRDVAGHTAIWTTDPISRLSGHRVTFLFEAAANVCTAVVDGELDDGLTMVGPSDYRASRQRGFGWFDPEFGAPAPGAAFEAGPGLERLRLHARAMPISEAVLRTR